MARKVPVNVKPGTKGFQETRVGMRAPAADPRRVTLAPQFSGRQGEDLPDPTTYSVVERRKMISPAFDKTPVQTPVVGDVPTSFVSPKQCVRCTGKGFVSSPRKHFNIPGLCFRCNGCGEEESDPEALWRERGRRDLAREESRKQVALRGKAFHEATRFDNTHRGANARFGLDLLEEREPERYQTCLRSMISRPQDTCVALTDYWNSQKVPG